MLPPPAGTGMGTRGTSLVAWQRCAGPWVLWAGEEVQGPHPFWLGVRGGGAVAGTAAAFLSLMSLCTLCFLALCIHDILICRQSNKIEK